MVVAEHLGEHGAVRSDDHLLVQRGHDRLGDSAFDLPAALLGIDHHARVGGLHRLQDANLSGVRIHRDPKALDVERHRPWCALVAAVPDQRRRQFGELDQPRAALHAVRGEFAGMRTRSSERCRRGQHGRPELAAGREHRRPGHDGTGRAESSGVITRCFSVGLVHLNPVGRGVQRGSDQLRVHRGGAVAELRRADRQPIATAGGERHRCLGEVAPRWDRRDHGERHALADAPT